MSLSRRSKAVPMLISFVAIVFICYGYYTLSDMNVKLIAKENLVIRSARHEKVLKEQLKGMQNYIISQIMFIFIFVTNCITSYCFTLYYFPL